ncbi:helix-turn-helix domain-containing protein [Paenalcaligenes niemegkensis]|uniref:IclR family transcriptional regulator n=1 Tax=Paenalcaligenes niemegkensis TaxID=2895469 RepID=UPI001EE97F86|nr:helix-turn-helix domain-containing protein [Paenalcaligenes niemegkensis]MCQ9617712.1 helix-turn-helix domain-containing protein [Paenalcaligenes niemegkensis]
MDEQLPVLAVERAILVLNAFKTNEPSVSLHELSIRTGLYKSTLLRQLGTLIQHHCVVRLSNGQYQLGARVLNWAHVYKSSLNLDQHVPPVLDTLVNITGEGASFFALDGDMRVCLYRSDSNRELRDHIREGELLPLDKGAAGHILIRYSTPSNMPAPEVLMSIGEREAEIAALAAPVFSAEGLKGALALSGPATRFSLKAQRNGKKQYWMPQKT